MSSQGMQDRFGAKSGNWMAGHMDCQPLFQFPEPRLSSKQGFLDFVSLPFMIHSFYDY